MRGLDTTKTQIERGHDDESARDRDQIETATEEEFYREIPYVRTHLSIVVDQTLIRESESPGTKILSETVTEKEFHREIPLSKKL